MPPPVTALARAAPGMQSNSASDSRDLRELEPLAAEVEQPEPLGSSSMAGRSRRWLGVSGRGPPEARPRREQVRCLDFSGSSFERTCPRSLGASAKWPSGPRPRGRVPQEVVGRLRPVGQGGEQEDEQAVQGRTWSNRGLGERSDLDLQRMRHREEEEEIRRETWSRHTRRSAPSLGVAAASGQL